MGLGCSAFSEQRLLNVGADWSELVGYTVTAMCNLSLTSTLVTIAKTVCKLPPRKNTKFIQDIVTRILEHVSQGKHVYLVGHSYGGACVMCAVEVLAELYPEILPHLNVATFGSLYVTSLPEEVNIKHYMYTHDVALKCNRLHPNIDKKDITWLKSKTPHEHLLFGTTAEWSYHNDYIDYIMQTFKERRKSSKRKSSNDKNKLSSNTLGNANVCHEQY